jgi:hypothetical protein
LHTSITSFDACLLSSSSFLDSCADFLLDSDLLFSLCSDFLSASDLTSSIESSELLLLLDEPLEPLLLPSLSEALSWLPSASESLLSDDDDELSLLLFSA